MLEKARENDEADFYTGIIDLFSVNVMKGYKRGMDICEHITDLADLLDRAWYTSIGAILQDERAEIDSIYYEEDEEMYYINVNGVLYHVDENLQVVGINSNTFEPEFFCTIKGWKENF